MTKSVFRFSISSLNRRKRFVLWCYYFKKSNFSGLRPDALIVYNEKREHNDKSDKSRRIKNILILSYLTRFNTYPHQNHNDSNFRTWKARTKKTLIKIGEAKYKADSKVEIPIAELKLQVFTKDNSNKNFQIASIFRDLPADLHGKMRAYCKPIFYMIVREENGPDENQPENEQVILVEADQQPIDQLPVPNLWLIIFSLFFYNFQ